MPAGGAAAASGGTAGERWATHALHRMVRRMQDAREGTRVLRAQLVDAHAAVSARSAAHVDPQSGLTTPEFLARWTNTGGPTALPVGVALIDIAALDDAEHRLGRRAAYHAARRVAAAVSEPLGPVDAAVRLSEREFALVVPGASSRHLAGLVDAVVEQLELSSDGYPNVPLTGPVAWTVTLARPLPLDDLHLALGTPDQPATTLTGDPIIVREPAGGAAGGAHHRDEPLTDRMPRLRVPDAATTDPPEPDAPSRASPDADAGPRPVPDRHEHPAPTAGTGADGSDGAVSAGSAGSSDDFDVFDASRRSGPVTTPPSPDGDHPARTNGTGPVSAGTAEEAGTTGSGAPRGPAPSPAPRSGRRRLGGEPALSMLSDLPRRGRRDGVGRASGSVGSAGSAASAALPRPGDGGGDPPPTAS